MSFATRRQWLGLTAAFALRWGRVLNAGQTVLSESPRISVQDFGQYPEILTPSADFYVRNHFTAPAVDLAKWTIQIRGAVRRDVSLSIDDLRGRKQHTLTAVLECAGNGAGAGGVGCGEWNGPSLGEILAECGLTPHAKFVRLVGADSGREPDLDASDVPYSRVMPLERAMRPEALLALAMNGAALSSDHGAPVRFLLGGSYGMNSVKWLRRIELLEEPGHDFFMDHRFRRVSKSIVGGPVDFMVVKSMIARPKPGAALRGVRIPAGGYAWAGSEKIARVEIATDSGPWQKARLLTDSAKYAWTPWKFETGPLQAGVHILAVRAFTASGESQPATRDARREDEYELNHYHQIRCMLRP